jgi:hypothetical protein
MIDAKDPFSGCEPTFSQMFDYIPEDPEVCCQCGSREGVQMGPSYTMYEEPKPTRFEIALDERPLSPNRDRPYCRSCAKQHEEFWADQWRDYYNNVL